MFFVGAFSGNLLYLILAISYLAGFSALAFRSTEDQTKDVELSDVPTHQILCGNNFHEHSAQYFTNNTNLEDQALSKEISLPLPVITHSKFLFIPPLLAPRSHFSGSALFSRPPPYSLV